MESILYFIIAIILIVAIVKISIFLLPVFIVVGIAVWIYNKFKESQQPTQIPDDPFQEIYKNQNTNPFEDDFYQPRQSNTDVIDVEYTEHEDDSND